MADLDQIFNVNERMKKLSYSLLDISDSLFSTGTSFQNLTNHTYPGKNNTQSDNAYDKRKSNYISWKQIFIQLQVYNCRDVSSSILQRNKTIFCFMTWTEFQKPCTCPRSPGTRDIVVCLKYWMANWYFKSNINKERSV